MTHDWATDKAIDLMAHAARYQYAVAVEMIAMELRTMRHQGEIVALQEVLQAEASA
jgi:hypothetical protein